MPELFNEALKSAWSELVSLNGERARAEEEIEREFAAEAAAAERDFEESKRGADQRLEEQTQSIEEECRRAVKQAKKSCAAETEKTRRAYEVELKTIDEKGDHSEREAKKQLEEAIWLAETVFEATEDQPDEQFEQDSKALQGHLDEIESIENDARQLLRRARQGRLAAWSADETVPGSSAPADEAGFAGALEERIAGARAHLGLLRRQFLAQLLCGFRLPLLFIVVAGGAATLVCWREGWQVTDNVKIAAAVAAGVCVLAAAALYLVVRSRLLPIVERLRTSLVAARGAHAQATAAAAERRDAARRAVIERREADIRAANEKYGPILEEIAQRREHHRRRIEDKYPKLLADLQSRSHTSIEQAGETRARGTEEIRRRHEEEQRAARALFEQRTQENRARHEQRWEDLVARWREATVRIGRIFDEARSVTERLFVPFSDASWRDWRPPRQFVPAIRFGRVAADVAALPGALSSDERLSLPWAPRFDLPATLAFPDECSLLVETAEQGADTAVAVLQTVMFRLLTAQPPAKVRFTIIDPVGLGQNFAGFMHLADHLEALVTDRIWTETRHIEQRLTDLTDHMENVIQKYLRNEYASIAEYNARAGEIAEPYRFLVIANFPVNFSEAAAKRLASIVSSGARCGVYTLIAMDSRQPVPPGIELSDLRRDSIVLAWRDGRLALRDDAFADLPLHLDAPPDPDFMIPILRTVGAAARDSSRVEVPFDVVAPRPQECWSGDSRAQVRTPLGRMGATALQHLELGRGTSQHVLIAGKTGSGKSTLLNVLITNIALWYSPDEVQLYLVDFKKGVEFKPYATHRLPHARAIAIESDREFGLSVLQRLDLELKRRGDCFRQAGVQDLAGYRASPGAQVMPRTLLIIDEFQEFFVEDDRIAQEASLLLDRLVRQGRAFGIHVILGSQTLGGAYSLAKSTMGQMAVRIALQCSEADSYLILSEDNSAARLLARPGEAIYNDAAGRVEGNSPFQIVWLNDQVRERCLERVAAIAAERGFDAPEPIVFEGNAPAELGRNRQLRQLLERPGAEAAPAALAAWLGEAVAIKDPTAAVFRRQTGGNLLIVGQRDDAAVAILTSAMVSVAAGHRAADAAVSPPTFTVMDGLPGDSPFAGWTERVAASLPNQVRGTGRRPDEALKALADEVERRQHSDHGARPLFLIVAGLQRFRDLRQSDDFSFSVGGDEEKPPAPDKLFRKILADGPAAGVHCLVWCDTASNAERALDRATLRDFEMRVVFQMSASDSTNLIDSPAANKLGPRHALFYSEERGTVEKFRPYGLPEPAWFDEVARALGAEREPQRA